MRTFNSSVSQLGYLLSVYPFRLRSPATVFSSFSSSSRRYRRTNPYTGYPSSIRSLETLASSFKNEVDEYTDFTMAPGWSSKGGIVLPPSSAFSSSSPSSSSSIQQSFGVTVYFSFLTQQEHDALVQETDKLLQTRRLESGHWDGVIQGYKEIPRSLLQVSPLFLSVAKRAQNLFPQPSGTPMNYVHILDLAAEPEGRIDGHVDSVKFSGSIVAGICLLSPAVMRLSHETSNSYVDLYLPKFCLYILTGEARYYWKHAILAAQGKPGDVNYQPVVFKGKPILRDRRISLMLRDELEDNVEKLPVPQIPQQRG